MPGLFARNRVAGQPSSAGIPGPGQVPEQYNPSDMSEFYGSMPIPATAFIMSGDQLRSLDAQPTVRTVASNASVVDRRNRRNGMVSTGGRQSRKAKTPQMLNPVFSSDFQEWLLGPQVNYILNACWYSAGYPAASVMLGGLRNQGLSTKVAQLPTRVTGGPGPAAMTARPRFKSVQTIPRYSTMPPMYNTTPTTT